MASVEPARHVKMHLKNQATKIDGVIRTQKMSITKMVGKCHDLLLRFESNQKIANSILMKKTANEFHTTHTKLIETMNDLYQSTQDYTKISFIASENMSNGMFEQKIIEQNANLTYYANIVEKVKEGHKIIFKDIYHVLDVPEKAKKTVSNQLWEFKPDTYLRPAALTFQSNLMETYHFYAQFERYINSSNSIPKGIIYSQALVNMDKYWLKQIEDRGFDKNTSLQDFIGFIKDVILSKFSLKTRQAALFDAKQGNIEHSADFLETLTNMVSSAIWTNISAEQANCYIFIHGVTKSIDKHICVQFLQEGKSY